MRKKHAVGLAIAIIPLTLYAVATLRTDTGFYYPTNKKHSDSNYYGYGDKNPFFNDQCHLANDYDYAEGTSVYSVGPGVVVSASLTVPFYGGTDGSVGGVMVIKHTKSDDTVFYGLYGHTNNFTVAEGDTVTGGQKIAEVGSYISGTESQPHLHFGVNPTSASIQGYTPTPACTDYRGFVDPEPYLIANSPKLSPAETCMAINDADSTMVNTILTTANVLDNDTDTDGDSLTVSAADSTSANGVEVTNNNDGTFTYPPAIDFSGSDTFNYTVTDNNGCTDEGTFTVTITTDTGTEVLTGSSGSSGGGSMNIVGMISLFALFFVGRLRKKLQIK